MAHQVLGALPDLVGAGLQDGLPIGGILGYLLWLLADDVPPPFYPDLLDPQVRPLPSIAAGPFENDVRQLPLLQLRDGVRADHLPVNTPAHVADAKALTPPIHRVRGPVGNACVGCHDYGGLATTLTEAILRHGGEAQAAQAQFAQLATTDQDAVITFLQSLVAPVFSQP